MTPTIAPSFSGHIQTCAVYFRCIKSTEDSEVLSHLCADYQFFSQQCLTVSICIIYHMTYIYINYNKYIYICIILYIYTVYILIYNIYTQHVKTSLQLPKSSRKPVKSTTRYTELSRILRVPGQHDGSIRWWAWFEQTTRGSSKGSKGKACDVYIYIHMHMYMYVYRVYIYTYIHMQ
jgi:hypothetical protein